MKGFVLCKHPGPLTPNPSPPKRGRGEERGGALLALLACAGLAVLAVPDCRADEAREIPVAEISRITPVDFSAEVLPILKASCLACHSASNAKGELVLETPESILQGGTNGPAVVAGDSGKSRVLQVAAHRVKPRMPPSNNRVGAKPLTPEQLALIRLWIDQGAKGSAPSRPAPIAWQAPAASLQPILALALSPDGKYAACSRADQLFVYDLPAARLVARLVDPELSSPAASGGGRAHVDFVRSLAFSPGGNLLASGGFRTVKLWQRPRTQRQAVLALDDTASAVAVDPTGTTAALALPGGRIALYDLASGKRLRELVDPQAGAARCLCFAPDGARLHAGSLDKTIRSWQVESGATLGALATPSPIHALAVLNGGQIATGHEDGQLRVWDPMTLVAGKGKPLAEIKAHGKPISSLAAVPSAPGQVVSASEEGLLRHWDARGAKLLREFNHGGPIAAVAARPDGARFASAGSQGVRLWDAATGALVAERKGDFRALDKVWLAEGEINFAKTNLYVRQQELREAEEAVRRETAVLEAAKKQVEQAEKTLADRRKAAAQPVADYAAAEKAAATAAEVLSKAGAARKEAEAAVAGARKTLMAAQENAGRARAAAAKEPRNADLAGAREAAEKAVAEAAARIPPAEQALRAAGEALSAAERKSREAANLAGQAREKAKAAENQVKEAETAVETSLYTVKTSRQILERDPLVPRAKQALAEAESNVQKREAAKKSAEQAARATEKPWRTIAFSPDGAWLLAGGDDGLLHVFDAQAGFPAEVLENPGGPVLALAGGQKGKVLSISADKQASVWQPAGAWTLLRRIGSVDDPNTLTDRVLRLAFHPGGKWLATAGGEPGRPGELKIWDASNGGLVRALPGAGRDVIFGVQFSPGGDLLATAGADRLVKVFSTADGKLLRTLAGHTNHVRGVAWRADGKVLASAGADNVIKLWEPASGTLLRTEVGDPNPVRGYRREVTAVSFVGDSDVLLGASGDKSLRLHHTRISQGLRTFEGQYTFLYCAAATADGKWVVAGGHDGVLRVWNGENGYLKESFPPPSPAAAR